MPRPDDRTAAAQSQSQPYSASLVLNPSQINNDTTAPRPKFTFQRIKSQKDPSLSSNRSGPVKRLLNTHDSDDNDDYEASDSVEVSGFDNLAGGAIRADGVDLNKKRELVIKVDSQNNWRDRPGVNTSKQRRNLLPPEVQAAQQGRNVIGQLGGVVETQASSMQYGLSFAQLRSKGVRDIRKATAIVEVPATASPTENSPPSKPLTQDDIALQALIKESKGDRPGGNSTLVIESTSSHTNVDGKGHYEQPIFDETSSFRADVVTRPDPASLDDYNAIPVEEFGAALLRGMGWKEGQAIGRGRYDTTSTTSPNAVRPRIPERRPGFLGIGAKDISGKGESVEAELGAWGKAAMRKANRKNHGEKDSSGTEGIYTPVLMKSKKTGEFLSEEEFQDRLHHKSAALSLQVDGTEKRDEWQERQYQNLERYGRDRDRRFDRHGNQVRDRDRSRSSGRDNDRQGNGKHGETDRFYRDRGLSKVSDIDRDRDQMRHDRERGKDRARYRDSDRRRHSPGHSSSRRDRGWESAREYDRNHDREIHQWKGR